MTHPDTTTPDPTSDDAELPDHQCVEVADETGERCRNAAIPGVDRCHSHVDYADLAESVDSEPMTATAPEDGRRSLPDNHEISRMKTPSSPTQDARKGVSYKKPPQGGAAKSGGNGR